MHRETNFETVYDLDSQIWDFLIRFHSQIKLLGVAINAIKKNIAQNLREKNVCKMCVCA